MKTYKIVVLGDFGVGKTSLIRRYVLDEFSETYRATIGVHIYKYGDTLEGDGLPVSLVVWDIEGAPLPGDQTRRYIVGASGAIVVGDLTRADPFSAMWQAADMFEEVLPGRPLCLAFNKSDIASVKSPETVRRMAHRYDCSVFETSALTGDAVNTMFRTLARSILSLGL